MPLHEADVSGELLLMFDKNPNRNAFSNASHAMHKQLT